MDLNEVTSRVGQATSDGMLVLEVMDDFHHRILWACDAFCHLSGYDAGALIDMGPVLGGRVLHPRVIELASEVMAQGAPARMSARHRKSDGNSYDVVVEILPWQGDGAPGSRWIYAQRDVTQDLRRQTELSAREQSLVALRQDLDADAARLAGIEAIAQEAEDLITLTDLEFRVLWANPAFEARAGHPTSVLRGHHHCELVHKRSTNYGSRDAAVKAVLNGAFVSGDVLNTDHTGAEYWTDLKVTVLRDATGRPDRFLVVERDVTEARRNRLALENTRAELRLAAMVDPLTRLPNRQGFEMQFQRMAETAALTGQSMVVALIDIERFGHINHALGHAAGDAVLQAVGERLHRRVRPDSLAARVGIDEFALLRLLPAGRGHASWVEDLRTHLIQPVRIDGTNCYFDARVGISVLDTAPFDCAEALARADQALYQAKGPARRRVVLYTDDMGAAAQDRRRMSDDLSAALRDGGLMVYYQPQVSAATGQLDGLEALVRWQHPERGVIGPDVFLPLARELNQEGCVDRAVMQVVEQDLALLNAQGMAVNHIAINLSNQRLNSDEIVQEFSQLSIDRRQLSLELVESSFLDERDTRVSWTLSALRDLGFRLEIDDFGTGHASVAGLFSVQPDRLKIDRSLLMHALEDPARRELFRLIAQMGQTLGIGVTAEGVETLDHARLACDAGCSLLQGYLFGRPAPLSQLIEGGVFARPLLDLSALSADRKVG